MKKYTRLIIIFWIFMTSTSYAAETFFNVSAVPETLTINLNIPNQTYLTAGIQMTSSDFTLSGVGTECIPWPSGYCLFPISQAKPKTFSLSGFGPSVNVRLCLNGQGPTSCQNYQVQIPLPTHAYIVDQGTGNNDSGVSLCAINEDGTLSNCNMQNFDDEGPLGIAVNNFATMAYIALNNVGAIAVCNIDPNTKALTCNNDSQGGIFNNSIGVALNRSNTMLYVTTQGGGDIVCSLLPQGAIQFCVNAGQSPGGILEGIVINAANTFAYVVQNTDPNQNSGSVFKCTINQDGTGTFESCEDLAGGPISFSFPELISLDSTGNNAYIANGGDGTVSKCSIDATTGNFTACENVNPNISFNGPKQAVLNTLAKNAYVSVNGDNTVSLCTVDINGDFSACIDSGAGAIFPSPWSIALF